MLQQSRRGSTRAEAVTRGRKMFQSLRSAQIDFDVPAPIAVGGLLFAGALAKEGCAEWALGGLVALYLLYLAIQYCKRTTVVRPQPAAVDSL
jgi:hypothetical protein